MWVWWTKIENCFIFHAHALENCHSLSFSDDDNPTAGVMKLLSWHFKWISLWFITIHNITVINRTWCKLVYLKIICSVLRKTRWRVAIFSLFIPTMYLYTEWPHRQGGCLACCGCTFDSRRGCTDLYYARGSHGVLLIRVGGATSQLDLPSLTPL